MSIIYYSLGTFFVLYSIIACNEKIYKVSEGSTMIKKIGFSLCMIILFVVVGCGGGFKKIYIKTMWEYFCQKDNLVIHKSIYQPTIDNNGIIGIKIFNKSDVDIRVKFRLKVYYDKSEYDELEKISTFVPKVDKGNVTYSYVRINVVNKDYIVNIGFSEFEQRSVE